MAVGISQIILYNLVKMTKVYERVCDYCNKYYKSYGRYYCSHSCRLKDNLELFKKYGEKGRQRRWAKAERGRYVECKFCGKEKWKYPYNIKEGTNQFCSKKCANIFNAKKLSNDRKGKGNPMYGKRPWNYIDGKKSHYYTKAEWQRIAQEIRKRDKFLCQNCGKKGFIVHHKKPRRWGGTNDPSNLEVLCRQCHAWKHVQLRKKVMLYDHI